MLIILFFILLIVVGTVIDCKTYSDSGGIIRGIGVVLLGLVLIIWPISYYSSEGEIERYHVLVQSLEESRNSDGNEIERAAILKKITEYNMDIASVRYWNETIFDIFINDDLAELEYIE